MDCTADRRAGVAKRQSVVRGHRARYRGASIHASAFSVARREPAAGMIGDNLRMAKVGRNALCPCGSGRKYKKCHLDRDARATRKPLPEVPAELRQRIQAEAKRLDRLGQVRPVITAVHQGHRFVAVGSRLYYDKKWNTFTDFLLFYVHDVMGPEWWREQRAASGVRHPLLTWYDHIVNISPTLPRTPSGLIHATPDGMMTAYLMVAYDLYILRDNNKLQDDVVRRLRDRVQFEGARYELFVAATFIRAGCGFTFDDESDGKRKHPEFVATDPSTRLEFAVEAKARQGVRRPPFDIATIRPAVRDLLLNAARKKPRHPLVVFLEVNVPPGVDLPIWVGLVDDVVKEVTGGHSEQPFAAVLSTNRPHLYGEPGQADPVKGYSVVLPTGSPVTLELAERLVKAVSQYGHAPSLFPDDFTQ
jgi:hypothetical protein